MADQEYCPVCGAPLCAGCADDVCPLCGYVPDEDDVFYFDAAPELDQAINEGSEDYHGRYTIDDLTGL